MADNNGNVAFFQSRNPGIKSQQSRDFGIRKVGRDPGIPGFGIPGLQSLVTDLTHKQREIYIFPLSVVNTNTLLSTGISEVSTK